MMKKIKMWLNKCRRWLIRKLGGEQIVFKEYKSHILKPIPLYSKVTVRHDWFMRMEPSELERVVKRDLAEMIVNEILKNDNLYIISEAKDLDTLDTHYQMYVLVVSQYGN